MTAGIDHDLLNQVPGDTDLIAWFDGQVPSFHDAEVLELALDRVQSRCRVKIHAFRMTSETDTEGYFKCVKHVIVTFEFAHVCALELEGFNHQNAIYGLELLRLPNGRILMEMEAAYGFAEKSRP